MHIYLYTGFQHYYFSKRLFHYEYSIYQRCYSGLRQQKWDHDQYHHTGGKLNSMHHSHQPQQNNVGTVISLKNEWFELHHLFSMQCSEKSPFQYIYL